MMSLDSRWVEADVDMFVNCGQTDEPVRVTT